VKTEVKAVAENEVLLEVEVPQDEVQRRYDQTLRKLAREITLPGFRKGKVPPQMALGRLGKDYVLNQMLEDFLPEWYEAALHESAVVAVSMPELDMQKVDTEEPFSFSAKVQVRPTPSLGQYKDLEVPKRSAEVTDDQVSAQLALLQERFASLKPADDRAVQNGDFVVVDLQGSADGAPIEGASATDYMVQVGSGQLIPGFEDNLIGMRAGEHKEFEVTFPTDYAAEDLRGKRATFAVDVKEIKEKVVPELGDDFARDVSEFETLEELRADVRERLGKVQAAAVEREFRTLVVDKAVANATVNVPPAMVEREAHALYHDLESHVGEEGLTMEAYLGALGKTAEQVEEELKPRAEMNVRRRLVLDAVREAEGIQVSDDEVRERIKADAELLGRDPNQLVLDMYASGRHTVVRDELLMAKTVDFLVEHAVPIEMPAEQQDGDGPSAEAATGKGKE
jgi:trigger factor